MKVQIKETGEIKTLSIIDRKSGVNYVSDLIGNAGALNDGQFKYQDYDGTYLADQGTYDWWAQYIEDSETTDREIDALAEKLGIDASKIRERVGEAQGQDYEEHRREAKQAMREIEEEQNF